MIKRSSTSAAALQPDQPYLPVGYIHSSCLPDIYQDDGWRYRWVGIHTTDYMTMEIGVGTRIADSSSASKPKVVVRHRDATYLFELVQEMALWSGVNSYRSPMITSIIIVRTTRSPKSCVPVFETVR
jgi:hypothetical protein